MIAAWKSINMRVPKSDTAGRIGGEEFKITAPEPKTLIDL